MLTNVCTWVTPSDVSTHSTSGNCVILIWSTFNHRLANFLRSIVVMSWGERDHNNAYLRLLRQTCVQWIVNVTGLLINFSGF